MSQFIPSEKGTTIRQPSTANLMIDSADRLVATTTPWNFQITRPQSILNGFFTRIATTEVVLEWNEPNGFYWDQSMTATWATGPATQTFGVLDDDKFYTAEQALDALAAAMNAAFGTNVFEIVQAGGQTILQTSDNSDFTIVPSDLTRRLGFLDADLALNVSAHTIYSAPDLRPYRYLDFVSAQLTYNQDLKDGATNSQNRDVLCRWYFAWDQPPTTDGYGFPILMGMQPFVLRRLFNPPKQIRWDNIQPLGNISFQVYGDDGNLVENAGGGLVDFSNWLMTLQISEV